jgi:hypothetical protein
MKKAQVGVVIFLLVVIIILLIAMVVFLFSRTPTSKITGFASIPLQISPIASQTYDIEGFNEIFINGKGNLFLTQGEDYDVEIEAEENVLEILKVEKEGSALVIGDKRTLLSRKPINIFITMPEVLSVKVSGSGNIEGENLISSEELEIVLAGSGDVNLDVEVEKLITKISGSGNGIYSGKANSHEIIISGSGDIKALNLETEKTKVTISGFGDTEVFANDELQVKISGSGKVEYKGDPSVIPTISGRGSVVKV